MSEAQLEKITAQKDALEADLKLLGECITYAEAAKKIVEYVEKQPDSFLNPTNDEGNEFALQAKGGGCTIL